MKKLFYISSTIFVVLLVGFWGFLIGRNLYLAKVDDLQTKKDVKKPYLKYSILEMSKNPLPEGEIKIIKELEKANDYTSYLFEFEFNPEIDTSLTKKTTGIINIPAGKETYPLVIMLRGFVDQKIYTSGMGTKNSASFFAANGLITVAPDFLGYATSDPEAQNIFEARFQTYVTAVSLTKSLHKIEKWNKKDVFIWGHSNGGQIALTTLEITGAGYPTVLWAPVSKPFPYSVLYYTDESEDKGKLIRSELAKFEDVYDTDFFSLDCCMTNINAPIQIHQGTADDAVPKEWSDILTSKLEGLDKKVDYFVYQGADHNLQPSWNQALSRSFEFFEKHAE